MALEKAANPAAASLAVARLEELSPARSHRCRDGQPMQGFCLISGEQGHIRVTLYVENGRTLTDRSGQAGFYYEGWLVGPAGPISLGAFNLGPEGQGSATRVIASSVIPIERAEVVRVTAEPFGGSEAGSIAVLEGRLVWLETGSPATPGAEERVPEAAQYGLPTPEPALQAVAGGRAGGWGSVARSFGPATAEARADESDTPGDSGEQSTADDSGDSGEQTAADDSGNGGEQTADDGPAGDGEQTAGDDSAENGEQTDADDGPAEGAKQTAGDDTGDAGEQTAVDDSGHSEAQAAAAGPEPRHANPLAVQVQLVQRHPMAPRAAGTATLNLRQGTLTLALRGLPSPTALGRDRSTGRPLNVYRVWLINQDTQVRTPVGYCQRAFGENFRFSADGLPLNRNHAILVTAEDRTATDAQTAPQVLIGSYEP